MYSDRKSIQSPHFVDLELYSKTFLLSLFFIYLKNIYFDLIALKGIGRRLCQSLSHVQLFCDPMSGSLLGSSVHGVPRQEYWSGLPFPPPGYLPDPGIEPESPVLAGRFFTTEPPGKPTDNYILVINYGDICPSKEI